MGDAAGVGPEIIAKALSLREVYDVCRPVVIGDLRVMEMGCKVARLDTQLRYVKSVSDAVFRFGEIDVLDLKNIDIKSLVMGKPQAMAGKAAYEYIEKAVDLSLRGEIHAIVTAPINKTALNLAGYRFAGHTEILASLTGTKKYAMMLSSRTLRVIHVSTHVSLKKACDLVKKDRILETIKLGYKALEDLGIEDPKIAVSGLNPHAGEGGLFGREEIEEIIPAVKEANILGIRVYGPLSPDTVFLRASKGEFDLVVAMYHDQGHIAFKMLGFTSGVNVTIGLPVIRTSVDHGTAYRKAGLKLGTADPSSLVEAIKLASKMAEKGKQNP
ncbi:MAG: 4-hydroxythreonine-4-phosphate dehydrogenase PdxA [Candidatus Bathyarchaeia archaeon]